MVVALVVMVLLAVMVRALAGSWFHPSAVLAGIWVALFAAPTLGGLPATPLTMIVIFVILAGAFATAAIRIRPSEVCVSAIHAPKLAVLFVLGSGVAGAVSALLVYRANGVSLGTVLDYNLLLDAASDVTVRRYGNDLTTPALSTLLLAWLYAGALLAPFVTTGLRRGKLLAVLFAPLFGGAFYALTTTIKAALIIAACNTLGAWLVTKSLRTGGIPELRPRVVLGVLTSATVLAISFVYFTAVRAGGWTPGNRDQVLGSVLVYTGGGIPAFEAWLNDPQRIDEPLGWGGHTFAGLAKYPVGDPSLGNAYADVRAVGPSETNVYTILRPLTEDFTLPGSVLVVTLGALAAAVLYRRAILKRRPLSALIVAAWLGVVLFSSATSTLTFTSVCLGLSVALILGRRWIRLLDPDAPPPEPPQSVRPKRRPTRREREIAMLRQAAQRVGR